jgi:hypothetical protein
MSDSGLNAILVLAQGLCPPSRPSSLRSWGPATWPQYCCSQPGKWGSSVLKMTLYDGPVRTEHRELVIILQGSSLHHKNPVPLQAFHVCLKKPLKKCKLTSVPQIPAPTSNCPEDPGFVQASVSPAVTWDCLKGGVKVNSACRHIF